MSLFELADFDETRVEWVALFKPHGITLLSLVVGHRCRDCGVEVTNVVAEGTIPGVGIYTICADCLPLDPHWGVRGGDVEALTAAREERRHKYLRKVAA